MDGRTEFVGAVGKQFDAVVDTGDAAGEAELADGDGFGGVETGLVDPGLDAGEGDDLQVD